MKREHVLEFLATVAAVLVGLIVGKKVSQLLGKAGVPISSNDPLIVPVPSTNAPVVASPPGVPGTPAQAVREGDA
jgi:hypothetical protein